MAQLFAFVSIGTAALLLASILLILRAEIHGRRPAVALTRRWIATSTRTSSLVVGLLSAIAVGCFASLPASDRTASSDKSAADALEAQPAQGTTFDSDGVPAQEWDALRSYAAKIDTKPQSPAATPDAAAAALPDVETMIAQLVARLEKQPNDLKGWKMLGWSYLNTDRPDDAAKAYETALKLEPNDEEAKKALDRIRSAPAPMAQSSPLASESSESVDGAIRGMVERLAERLETSPNDEEGWTRLMRSRMTLGETDAAKAALAKALETFATDAAAKARLTAAAREMGVPGD